MKKFLGLLALATLVALTFEAYIDTGKSSPEKSPQLAQAQNVAQPGGVIMASNEVVANIEVIEKSLVPNSQTAIAAEVNSSITKTDEAGILVKSDVANIEEVIRESATIKAGPVKKSVDPITTTAIEKDLMGKSDALKNFVVDTDESPMLTVSMTKAVDSMNLVALLSPKISTCAEMNMATVIINSNQKI